MQSESPQPVYPLSISETVELNDARRTSPERPWWVRIEHVRRDTAGKLRISFTGYKRGYYQTLQRKECLPEGDEGGVPADLHSIAAETERKLDILHAVYPPFRQE